MALSILTYPANLSSVTNEMLFVINEATKANDPVTYPNYKYILDIYVDGSLVARQTAVPDPDNHFGIFDVSTVLRNYVPEYRMKAEYDEFAEIYEINLDYQVKLGEIYSDTQYTDIVTDSERTCYKTYKEKPFTDTDRLSDITTGVASNRPLVTNGYRDSIWHLVPFYSNVTGVEITFNALDSAGNSLATDSITYGGDKTINQPNLSLVKLTDVYGLNNQEVENTKAISYSINSQGTYRLDLHCTKYPIISLAWLNPYGGYESYDFAYVSKRTNEVTRKEYTQIPYKINASGIVSYDADGVLYGGKNGFAATTKSEVSLTSHILSKEEYTWLADLFSSPQVYMYSETLELWMPVVINSSNYEYRTYLNSRLTPLQFSVQLPESYNSQYL